MNLYVNKSSGNSSPRSVAEEMLSKVYLYFVIMSKEYILHI